MWAWWIMKKSTFKTRALFIALIFSLLTLCSCKEQNTIVGKSSFIEIQVDNSEETGELSYTEPLKVSDRVVVEELRKKVNSAKKYTENEFLEFESCPIVTFYLENGNKLYLVASDYKGIFYTSAKQDFSDKTLYVLEDDFKLASYIQNLYNQHLD